MKDKNIIGLSANKRGDGPHCYHSDKVYEKIGVNLTHLGRYAWYALSSCEPNAGDYLSFKEAYHLTMEEQLDEIMEDLGLTPMDRYAMAIEGLYELILKGYLIETEHAYCFRLENEDGK